MSYKHRSCTGRSFSMCREDDGCHYTKGPDRRYCRKIGKKAPHKHHSKRHRRHSTYSLLRYLHSRKRHSKRYSRKRHSKRHTKIDSRKRHTRHTRHTKLDSRKRHSKRHTKRRLSSLFLF